MNCVYVKNEEEYHGGFPMYSSCEKNKYLGGNDEMIVSRYNTMVVPFGLYHRPSNNHLLYENDEYTYDHKYNEDEDEYETQCIDPELFDKLLDAVRIDVSKKRKHKNNKTKKHKK
jgi:hypothetical protein